MGIIEVIMGIMKVIKPVIRALMPAGQEGMPVRKVLISLMMVAITTRHVNLEMFFLKKEAIIFVA